MKNDKPLSLLKEELNDTVTYISKHLELSDKAYSQLDRWFERLQRSKNPKHIKSAIQHCMTQASANIQAAMMRWEKYESVMDKVDNIDAEDYSIRKVTDAAPVGSRVRVFENGVRWVGNVTGDTQGTDGRVLFVREKSGACRRVFAAEVEDWWWPSKRDWIDWIVIAIGAITLAVALFVAARPSPAISHDEPEVESVVEIYDLRLDALVSGTLEDRITAYNEMVSKP